MSVIAEFETHVDVMMEALSAAPGTTVEHDDAYYTVDDELRWLFWSVGGDQSAFRTALADDPTVAASRVITTLPDRRLYRATLAGDRETFALETANEVDAQILEATHDAERTVVRVRAPSRQAYATLVDALDGLYDHLRTRRLFYERPDGRDRHGVTDPQYEALSTALEAGYYAVPREASLASVADRLGVSESAASGRLRRGTASVLRNTLATDSYKGFSTAGESACR